MKFYGAIGFSEEEIEVRPGVFRAGIREYMYAGDYNRVSHSYQQSQHLNDDISLTAEISIIGDPHAFQNIHQIRYVAWRGTKWKVTSIDDAKHPRLVLTLGGEWNDAGGSQAETT